MALALGVRGTRDSDSVSPGSTFQKLISREALRVRSLGLPPELLQSAASGTEVTSLRGRALPQREHPKKVSIAEEPSSTCLQLPQEEGSLPTAQKPAPAIHQAGFV